MTRLAGVGDPLLMGCAAICGPPAASARASYLSTIKADGQDLKAVAVEDLKKGGDRGELLRDGEVHVDLGVPVVLVESRNPNGEDPLEE